VAATLIAGYARRADDEWSPPQEHVQHWLGEALRAADTLGLGVKADMPMGREERLRLRSRQSDWEKKWSTDAYPPPWRIQSVPGEILRATEEGWFPPGGSILDIGCGSGANAAWLAGHGYRVVGVDFAPSAISKAKEGHGDVDRVTFEVVDITRQTPPCGPFDALFDRGCFQGIPSEHRPCYVFHVAAAAKPNAPFLLLHLLRPDLDPEAIEVEVRTLCRYAFDVIDVAGTVMGHVRRSRSEIPGLAIRLVRRS
jgi:SAM-dependent methyltransferase